MHKIPLGSIVLVMVVAMMSAAPLWARSNSSAGPESGRGWGGTVQVSDHNVWAYDVDYYSDGTSNAMYAAVVPNSDPDRDSLVVYRSIDGGDTWTRFWKTAAGPGRKFTDVALVCGKQYLCLFMPQDTCDGVDRDWVVTVNYATGQDYTWSHFGDYGATGIITGVDADCNPNDSVVVNCVFRTDNAPDSNMMSMHSGDFSCSWSVSKGPWFNCSSPSMAWVRGNKWAIVYRNDSNNNIHTYVSSDNGAHFTQWTRLSFDTDFTEPCISACHDTGMVLVAVTRNSITDHDVMIFRATDSTNSEYGCMYENNSENDTRRPALNCMRYGSNEYVDWVYEDSSAGITRILYDVSRYGDASYWGFPETVIDQAIGGRENLGPKISYFNDGSHNGPAVFYVDRDNGRLRMAAGWTSGIAGNPEVSLGPQSLRLEQSVPNPVRDRTAIRYQLGKSGMVDIGIFNIAGQSVKTLFRGPQGPGNHTVIWDGRNGNGEKVSAGLYLCNLNSGGKSLVGKIIVIR